jgi:CDP-diacylglycerol--serine O-phosphatidyltransferase
MTFLFDKNNHFNLANIVTFFNITAGILAIYFITHNQFFGAALFAWLGGAFDILDGKIARKYQLSTQFGIQLDSFADFLSFVIVPAMFLYFAIFDKNLFELNTILVFAVFVYYIISGLRRLIDFNINSDEGEVSKYFVGVPTTLGAILLWILYLVWLGGYIPILFDTPCEYIVLLLIVIIGYFLNSKVKIPHP